MADQRDKTQEWADGVRGMEFPRKGLAPTADQPDVLKRLEEIKAELYSVADDEHTPFDGEIKWLLRLTRALLKSQGELIVRILEYHDGASQFHNNKPDCRTCRMIARAERVRKGEV